MTVRAILKNTGAAKQGRLKLRLSETGPESMRAVSLAPGSSEVVFDFPAGALPRWSEFTPVMSKATAELDIGNDVSRLETDFGVRTLATGGREILVNGKPTFFRGTLECCIFPLTGHPDMTGATWEKIMRTVKDYGLNHVRFHSWCPPEAAFEAADKHGVYLQVELPNWGSVGTDRKADGFFVAEGERILREYGNHPSFVFLCLGNELGGDFKVMDSMVRGFKAIDPDKLMTGTAFSFSKRGEKPGAADDYFITQWTATGWVRGQGFLNSSPPSTDTDYVKGVSSVQTPLLSHEVGQYTVYPDLSTLPKNTGLMRSTAMEAIRADLEKKGRLADAPRYTRDSGKLAVELYKEDVERALRTPGQAGIQLLDLHDFPGQSTATVGVLDAFWDSKGLVTREEFRRFTSPVVPLARMKKRVWENTETFTSGLILANFGPEALEKREFIWKLTTEDGAEIGSGSFRPKTIPLGARADIGTISQPLGGLTHASKLTLSVSSPGTSILNTWDVWVYPAKATPVISDVLIADSWNPRVKEALAAGARVLLTPPRSSLMNPIDARFIPVFWSPLHFAGQPGTFGASIEPKHPAFSGFPTATYTQWQWWELFATSCATDLSGVSPPPSAPLTFVDKFNRTRCPPPFGNVVSAKDVCSSARSISPNAGGASSLASCAAACRTMPPPPPSDPRVHWTCPRWIGFSSRPSSTFRRKPPRTIIPRRMPPMGNPGTFWHTEWKAGVSRLPATLTVDTFAVSAFKGIAYIPRQDMRNGRIGGYRIEAGTDGAHWKVVASRTFPEGAMRTVVTFPGQW